MHNQQQTSVAHPVFFPIPNPLPHIRSIDIPEPVIHPPGIDPYAVLNPNSGSQSVDSRTQIITKITDSDSGLEWLPPLDIDPVAAASWTQAITKSTDLTAYEHAGGTWSEPTIESTTNSHSPATSEVVAEQTVNDVTIIRGKNLRSIHCDVCNVTCDTEDVLKKHKEGKRHLKNMQKLAVSSAIAQPPAEDDTLYREPEKKKKKHDLLQNEASVDSLFVCGIPGLGREDQVTRGALCRDGLPNPISVSITPVKNAQDKLQVNQFLWCEVCKVNCVNENNLGSHILGKKHLKNLKNSKKIQALPLTDIASMATTPITSPAGNLKSSEGNIVDSEVLMGGKISWTSNVLSSHASWKENMNSLQKRPDLPSTHIASLVENPNEGKSAGCEVCGISCSSYEDLNLHIAGKKHKKNIKKTEKFFAPVAEGSLQDPKGNAVILERCKRKADRSLAGDEEPETKKQKMMKEEKPCGSSFTCKLCNVVYDSPTAFIAHGAGKNHSAMLLKLINAEEQV